MFAIFKKIANWFTGLFKEPKPRLDPKWTARFIEGDELPEIIQGHELVVARDAGTLWSAGLTCPCGCGKRLELMLLKEVQPRWDLTVDRDGLPSLQPSVCLKDGCKSHFWLKNGKVLWC